MGSCECDNKPLGSRKDEQFFDTLNCYHVVSVTIDGVWIGNWIYYALTIVITNNYGILTDL
jgi:hypothetical protein